MSKNDDEVLVRVDGVSKKFCRSLKKSLWYGVCDIASELNPFGRTAAFANPHKNLTTDGSDGHGYGTAGGNQRADSAEFLEGHSQAGLQMDSEKLASIRSANDSRASGDQTGSSAESVLIRDISGKKSSSALDSGPSPLDSTHVLRAGEFFAVKDVSFELRRGECLGLIGHNGAGKTTLLKMLNGLIKPDAGSITMRGRVGALIALGAGFNPILTGRENIYINGSVLGLSKKEIDAKIDEIIDFAEIREFIDTPVQNYSSGMQVRLGFAVATTLDPDVLILDEVLAVGDASFRNKCYRRIAQLRRKAAVIFVTHNMEQIARVCDSALMLKNGSVLLQGTAMEGVQAYEKSSLDSDSQSEKFISCNYPITKFELNIQQQEIESQQPLLFKVKIFSKEKFNAQIFRLTIYTAAGNFAADCNIQIAQLNLSIETGENEWNLATESTPLKNGKYFISVCIIDGVGDMAVWSHKTISINISGASSSAVADCQLKIRKI
jgi:lipopolysaccharide transport system ATP-binding protein